MSETAANHDPKTGFYVGVWIGLLCIAGLEVFLTYRGTLFACLAGVTVAFGSD